MTSSANSLLKTLDAGGIVYNIRHSLAGMPYAAFRWECSPSRFLKSFTALLEAEALRLTLHEPLGPGVMPDDYQCFVRQCDFPIARLYNNAQEQGRKLELTAAIPMGDVEPDITTLRTLLSHLANNADDLLGKPTGASRQAPQLCPARGEVSLPETLQEMGLHPQQEQGAFTVHIALPQLPVAGRFLVYHLGAGWIRVSAHLLEDERLVLDHLHPGFINQLQVWAPVGRFVSCGVHAKHRLGCEVATPFLGRPASAVIAESMRAATKMLGTAYKQATSWCSDLTTGRAFPLHGRCR